MIILSHRGFWKNEQEKNKMIAFERSLENEFGFETDFRDYKGELVVSHNPPDGTCVRASQVFELLQKYDGDRYIAVNIKADGLIELLTAQFKKYGIVNYFCFDMSVPQMVEYSECGVKFFTRQSEYEKEPVMLNEASGIWIDAFKREDWIDKYLIQKYLDMDKFVCLVSPELHKRDYKAFWKRVKESMVESDKLILCTDIPDKAKIYFGGKYYDKSDYF